MVKFKLFSGMWCHVVLWYDTSILVDLTASTSRMKLKFMLLKWLVRMWTGSESYLRWASVFLML